MYNSKPVGGPVVTAVGEDATLGRAVPLVDAHRSPGVPHLAVSVALVSSDRRWLVQRRSATKPLFAGRWANACCTHPTPGESPVASARRRVGDELGLHVEELMPCGTFIYRAVDGASGMVEHEHDHVFVGTVEADLELIDADPQEIAEVRLLPFDEAMALLGSAVGAPWAAEVLRRAERTLAGEDPDAVGQRAGEAPTSIAPT